MEKAKQLMCCCCFSASVLIDEKDALFGFTVTVKCSD